MSGTSLDGKVAIVTGAGRGIGRAEAMRLAAEGAAVVVNDVGASLIGEGGDASPAEEVVSEIRAAGGRACANTADVKDWEGGRSLVLQAIDEFGRLDVLVNNAGNARPKMIFNMSEDDWDLVTSVHLKGSFVATRFAAEHWRDECKRSGAPAGATIVFTTSPNGLNGMPGHINYVAAKAGIAGMTTTLATELAPYGVRVNAIAPVAFTRMTEELHGGPMFADGRRDDLSPENVAEVAAWLASPRSGGLTGQIVGVQGKTLQAWKNWHPVSHVETTERWTFDAIDDMKASLFPVQAPRS